ncbi:MAG: hypothetical protein COX77_04980 [Candidatus Komeilibacteria bacterium CG_4_10_14_0_2_um_filter_37_10]|uniref:DUF4870 domain-containing protein n=1 Tax=Candidatus Komeilibacteria bacterium CG_4_10_14_0_2_um_filter_37_10 TaxID=1974470 RepID=A0A2M7VD64_9BACT|nr:MAG: hypothetical protein COX77_04980 [Candidatus Komeilibacteria bacterium CG_4_10_14_0_2_um_filter_37_10]
MEQKETEKPKAPISDDAKKNGLIAALGYVWILCLVPLLLKRDSKFAQFHAKQGLVLFVIELVGWLIFWIPVIGWLLFIIVLVYAIMGIMNALQGNYWEMPYLGQWAKKLNI